MSDMAGPSSPAVSVSKATNSREGRRGEPVDEEEPALEHVAERR
jgi:hypothetical protein